MAPRGVAAAGRLSAEVRGAEELQRFVVEVIGPIPGVTRVRTVLVPRDAARRAVRRPAA